MLTSELLTVSGGLRHGFLTRRGGVSGGLYDSLNCGPGSADDPGAVAENRRRAMTRLGTTPESLITLYQIHSAEVVTVREPWSVDARPQADALVTDRPGLTLGILTADCAPVLFADAHAGVIGAAHAGWKGALNGVVEATITRMAELGARRDRVVAMVGPCIAQNSYEVGPDFPTPFLDRNPADQAFFVPSPQPGRFLFDLGRYVLARLHQCGIGQAGWLKRDTATEEELFFSYRRTTLRREADYGRQISVIALA
ncbi:Purine nucleoside phosphorylase DR_1966 [uncultured Gammaproteobacteria bacterium]